MIQDNTTKWKVRKFTDFASNQALPLGFMYQHLSSTVPLGSLPLLGGEYDRTLYADLWSWANENGLVVSEVEWQAMATAQGGSCSKFSEGNGSTTFRVPALKCWVKGANGVEEVGSYLEAGLPDIDHTHTRGTMNITGSLTGNDYAIFGAANITASGALSSSGNKHTSAGTSESAGYDSVLTLDASKSWTGETSTNSEVDGVYGNSNTVQPPSIVAMYCIVAYGTVTNVGNVDISNFIKELENVSQSVEDLKLKPSIETGTIISYGGNSIPEGFLACDGATVSRTTYVDLFAKIGTTYGEGDGSTTFNLPNYSNVKLIKGTQLNVYGVNGTSMRIGVDGNTNIGNVGKYGNNEQYMFFNGSNNGYQTSLNLASKESGQSSNVYADIASYVTPMFYIKY